MIPNQAQQAEPVAGHGTRPQGFANSVCADKAQGVDLLAQRVENRLALAGLTFLSRLGVAGGSFELSGWTASVAKAPDDHDDAHDRRRPHDDQRLVARFVNSLDVHSPEIGCYRHGDGRGNRGSDEWPARSAGSDGKS